MSASSGVLTVAAIFVVVVVLDGGSHGKTHNSAYQQGYQTGAAMRNRAGLPLDKKSVSLLRYCRRAPYAKDIPGANPGQWLAGYDAGCDGR